MIRFGIIGCGAITENSYLPAFEKSKTAQLTCLVDSDKSRISALGRGLDLDYAGQDMEAITDHVDAVIIAVPNYLHHGIARTFLEKGKHVLCEKPVTTTVEDCEDLLQMANSNALTFTVGHVRRFYPAVKKIKEIVAENILGSLIAFDFREGTVFSWPTVSGYIFDKEKAGGGVLMDIGVHLLDLLLWWLDDEPVDVDYADDALGGMEAFADINMTFSRGVHGRIRLSRLSVLRNSYSLRFEKGEVQWSPFNPGSLYIRRGQSKPEILAFKNENPTLAMLSDFSAAVGSKKKPLVTLDEALRSLKVIHHCYRTRKSLALDWLMKEGS